MHMPTSPARPLGRVGQFIPLSAMVVFSMVVFMAAVVNIYKISKAKLRVQNLADAVALNIASQEAQLLNTITDRNEWMNHMVAGVDPSQPMPQQMQAILPPGISYAEGHVFNTVQGARAYARLVKTINDAQRVFQDSYNAFFGARPTSPTSSISGGTDSLFETLALDIRELRTDPSIQIVAWNTSEKENQADRELEQLAGRDNGPQRNRPARLKSLMEPLEFRAHDIKVGIGKAKKPLIGPKYNVYDEPPLYSKTLGELLQIQGGVGWMKPDPQRMPTISVRNVSQGDPKHIGVGVLVSKKVEIYGLGSLRVTARAKAYVVKGSGSLHAEGSLLGPAMENAGGRSIPKFQPTFWVKLAK